MEASTLIPVFGIGSSILRILEPTLKELALDTYKDFRKKNLQCLDTYLEAKVKELNIKPDNLHPIAPNLAVKIIHEASFEENDFLREKWANLLLNSSIKPDQSKNKVFSCILNRFHTMMPKFWNYFGMS